MADGVDAAVEAVELPSRDSVSDRPRAQTSRFELMPRQHPMLAHRDSSDL
ncbi:MAG TPA: hypothetical protein VFU11_03435 [Solirubrobacterales bacterium]|nr:hypothetical protein [Solirubrobacterales bacterium]